MARQFRGRQQRPSAMQSFMQELPGLLMRYMFDRMSRGEQFEYGKARDVFQNELQEQRSNNSINLDIIRDHISEINRKADRFELQVEESRNEVDDALNTLKAHSSISIGLDDFDKTVTGSVTLPDHILNNEVLNESSKTMLLEKFTRLEQLKNEKAHWQNKRGELIKLNASLDKMDKMIEKHEVDPALAGEGLLAHVTDIQDFEAFWDERYAPIWEGDPYEEIAKDVFFQHVPTSTYQRAQVAEYVTEIETLAARKKDVFLSGAAPTLTKLVSDASSTYKFLKEEDTPFESLEGESWDKVAQFILSNTKLSTREQANNMIVENLQLLASLTDPFTFVQIAIDENTASPVINMLVRDKFPMAYTEMIKHMREPGGAFSQEYESLKELLSLTRTNQGVVDKEELERLRQQYLQHTPKSSD